MDRVHIIATGGTVASTAGEAGATPTMSGDAIVEAVPQLSEYAEVSVESISQTPGFDMDPTTIAAVGRRIAALDDDIAGVVVTHGTDTMAESAYYLDLGRDWTVPIVFTGAQRRPDEVGADGPANVRTAVRAAALDQLERGVVLAFDQELHGARDVTKAHTQALGTFVSPNTGPLARFSRKGVEWYGIPPVTPSVGVLETDATVPIITSGTGMDGAVVDQAIAAGADGLVVAGTGLGNVTTSLGESLITAVDTIPVVVTSRCFAGPTQPVYGTPGGGVNLANNGIQFAGDLPPWKARVALLLTLAAGRADEFEDIVARSSPG